MCSAGVMSMASGWESSKLHSEGKKHKNIGAFWGVHLEEFCIGSLIRKRGLCTFMGICFLTSFSVLELLVSIVRCYI